MSDHRRTLGRRARIGATAALAVAVVLGGCTDDGDPEAFCERLADIPPLGQVLGALDTSDPGGTETELTAARDQFRALESDAPGAIRDDVARVRQGVELVLEAVQEHPDDLPAAREAIAAQVDELPGLAQAAEDVVSYARTECDLTLS